MRISDWSSDVCSSDLLDFDNLLDATSTDHYRYADIEVVNAIFARQIGGAGQNPLLVLQICLGHFNTAGGRRIESRSGLQQADDLSTARTRALHDGVRSEEHPSELQSLMRISYAVFCLKKQNTTAAYQQTR